MLSIHVFFIQIIMSASHSLADTRFNKHPLLLLSKLHVKSNSCLKYNLNPSSVHVNKFQ